VSRLRLLLLLATAGGAGCADSIVTELGPQNNETVAILPDSFTYIATNLENVSDKAVYQWSNSEARLQIIHQSFLPHGYGLLVIKDAVGAVVDSTLLEYQLETESRAGVPGLWTITLIYTGAWGRAQFTLLPLPADAVPLKAPAQSAAPAGEASARDRRLRR
jgi:hypothetical protein